MFMKKNKNNKKNEDLQSRREFFKKAAKGALPILGSIILASVPHILKAKTVDPQFCMFGCAGFCAGQCYATCVGFCTGNCSGCVGFCKVQCIGCIGSCSGTCMSCTGTCLGTCAAGCTNSCAETGEGCD